MTPFLTALAHICAAIGVFIGVWTALILLAQLGRGFRHYWSLVLYLVLDVAINASVQLARHKRRRELGLTREQRRWRLGLGPRPPDRGPTR